MKRILFVPCIVLLMTACADMHKTEETAPAKNDEAKPLYEKNLATLKAYVAAFEREDINGVIAQIAGILGDLNIGISSILQPESEDEGATVPLVLMIHKATNGQITAALRQIDALECVKKPPRMIRVEHFT